MELKKELQTRLVDATHDEDLSAAISMVICENVGYQSLPERNVAEIVSAAVCCLPASLVCFIFAYVIWSEAGGKEENKKEA